MSDEIVKSQSTALLPPPDQDVVVLARNQHEIEQAQQGLSQWVKRKIEIEQAQLTEAQENLEHSKRMKIKTAGWERQVRRFQKRVDYYEKMGEAIDAGFCIVPNMEMSLIAVRTDRKNPPMKAHAGNHWSVPNVKHGQLPKGEGRYVDPRPDTHTHSITRKRSDGTEYKQDYSSATDFDEEIDFPLKVVRPQVLTDLDAAMKLGIFDEIGFIPQRQTGDPMVIGRIGIRQGYYERQVSFLITWWIDTRSL